MEQEVNIRLQIWEERGVVVNDYYKTDIAAAIVRGLTLEDIERYGSGVSDFSEEDYDRYDAILVILKERNIGK